MGVINPTFLPFSFHSIPYFHLSSFPLTNRLVSCRILTNTTTADHGSSHLSSFLMDFPAKECSLRRDGNGSSLFSSTPTHNLDLHFNHGDFPNPDPISSRSNKITPLPSPSIRYRECLRNHAAAIGGNIIDGCGEFMPGGEDGTLGFLKCAACECHRNFHRKEVDGQTQFSSSNRRSLMNPLQLPPPVLNHQKIQIAFHQNPKIAPPMNVAFGTESSSEELNVFHSSDAVQPPPPPPSYGSSKKRFRTKFTQEQKDKMLEFAEKVEWRFQKENEEEVMKICAEIGVKRQVLKVWMHNNKNLAKKQPPLE